MSEETPAPKPQPVPHPAPKPVQAAPAHATPTDSAAAAEAARWGRVDDDGKVWLRSSEGERIVGQYAASGSAEDALAIYVRRYLDLETQVSLLEARVETVNPDETQKSLKALAKDLKEPAAVGDIEALQQRVEALKERVAQRREALSEERKVAKQQALEHRTRIVERAEEISRQDPEQTHWRNSRTELSELFDEWRQAQRSEARFDRPTEQELWKRFSAARSAFDKNRRHHFTDLDQKRAEVTATKEKLIERAAELASSTDWAPPGPLTASSWRNGSAPDVRTIAKMTSSGIASARHSSRSTMPAKPTSIRWTPSRRKTSPPSSKSSRKPKRFFPSTTSSRRAPSSARSVSAGMRLVRFRALM